MMLARIRRDDVWRTFPGWGVILTLNAGVMTAVLAAIAARRGSPVSAAAIVMMIWATVAVYIAFGRTGSRCTLFDLGLPISARRIWLSHLAAMAAASTVVVVGSVWIVAVAARSLGGTVAPTVSVWSVGLLVEAVAVLAVILLELLHPSLARVPTTPGRVAWTVLVVGALLALVTGLAGAGPIGALVPAALAVAAFAWTYRSLPRAFVIVPREPAVERAAVAAPPERAGHDLRPTRRRVWLVTFRSLWTGPKELGFYPFIVLFGLFFGNALSAWSGESETQDLRFLYVPMATYMLVAFVAPRLASLHRVDPLPIPRRVLLAGLFLPAVLALVASYGAGALVAARCGARTEYVDFAKGTEGGRWRVTVPLRAYEVTWDGRVPEIASPWGESHPAERLPLYRGSTAALWNPFSAPPGSSAKFVALQISRAAEAVYGAAIAPETIEARWIETLPDGTVAGRGDSLPLRAEHPELSPRSGPLFPLILALTVTPWFLVSALLFRAYRPEIPEWVRQSIYWGGLFVIILLFLSQAVAMVADFAHPWLARALMEIPAWKLGRSAAATTSAWIVAGAVVAVAYRLTESQFRRMAVPTRPSKYSLIERMQTDV